MMSSSGSSSRTIWKLDDMCNRRAEKWTVEESRHNLEPRNRLLQHHCCLSLIYLIGYDDDDGRAEPQAQDNTGQGEATQLAVVDCDFLYFYNEHWSVGRGDMSNCSTCSTPLDDQLPPPPG